jgi:DNA-directed RNA polymerase specialized sigma24 family protein
MTESTGKRPRTVLAFIDDKPRTITEWARYLGLSKAELLRARIKRSGSLKKAVKDLQAGVNQPFSVRNTKGMCKRGHKIEGDNIVWHQYKGAPVARCRKCYVKEPKPRPPKKVKEKKSPRYTTYILESIDQTPRSIGAWARYAGVDDTILRKHLRSGRSLAEAVAGLKDGTLRRRTKNNPGGLKRAPVPRKHECVIESVDDVKRGIPEWAAYLGVKASAVQQRVAQMGSLPAAVRFYLDKAYRAKNNLCSKSKHELTPDNILHVKNSRTGKVSSLCAACARERVSEWGKASRKRNKKPKRNVCRKGTHKLEGTNVLWVKKRDGTRFGVCRACRYAYQNLRNQRKRMGLSTAKNAAFGLSLDEKLAHYIRILENGCHIWTGGLAGDSKPLVYFVEDGVQRSVRVRTLAWERKHGRTLPAHHAVMVSCGNESCVRGEHLHIVPMRKITAKSSTRPNQAISAEAARDILKHCEDVKRLIRSKFRKLAGDADDIAQEVSLRACTHWRGGDIRAFMLMAARHVAIDRLRQIALHGEVSLQSVEDEGGRIAQHEVSAWGGDPSRLYERMEEYELERWRYHSRLNRMSAATRSVYKLRALGMSPADIAIKKGRSINTIEQQLQAAYTVMRGRYNTKKFRVLFDGGDLGLTPYLSDLPQRSSR